MFWIALIKNTWKSLVGLQGQHYKAKHVVTAPTGDKMTDWVLNHFKKETGIDVSQDQLQLSRIKDEVKKARDFLILEGHVVIDLPFLGANSSGPKHFKKTITSVDYKKL